MARNVQAWLDARGRGAWLAAMILGFVFVWPLGLALLAYMIWSKRMFNRSCGEGRDNTRHNCGHRFGSQWGDKMGAWGDRAGRWGDRVGGFRSSGNTAFDAYKEETLRRLQDEQEAFQSFLQRLREAKDKTEFDAFMEDRAKSARPATDVGPSDPGRDGNL
jgi:predicted CopG family antitoxin